MQIYVNIHMPLVPICGKHHGKDVLDNLGLKIRDTSGNLYLFVENTKVE